MNSICTRGVVRLALLSFSFGATALAAPREGAAGYPPVLEGARVETYKTVGATKLTLSIFNPKDHQASDRRAAIVFFFGGGWQSGSPKQFEQQCRYLSSRGMVAITADYRVGSRHQAKAVQCVADAKSAIRWVRANAARLGIDPLRIAAGGGSAGGHIAGCTAYSKGGDEPGEDLKVSSAPNALVLFNPALTLAPIDGQAFEGFGQKVPAERLGIEPQDISPAHHVKPGGPPAIIFHGRADTTVPYVTAEVFAVKMKAANNRCELVGYDGQKHGFFNFGREGDQYFRDTLQRADEFLVSLGYLAGKGKVAEFFPGK